MKRAYVPNPKHKHPKGFGSLCPPQMSVAVRQTLIDKAIPVKGFSEGKLWAAQGDWVFCAHCSETETSQAWHGFPVIGCEVDERVLSALVQAQHIDLHQKRRLRAQRSLPAEWP